MPIIKHPMVVQGTCPLEVCSEQSARSHLPPQRCSSGDGVQGPENVLLTSSLMGLEERGHCRENGNLTNDTISQEGWQQDMWMLAVCTQGRYSESFVPDLIVLWAI